MDYFLLNMDISACKKYHLSIICFAFHPTILKKLYAVKR